MTKPTYTTTYYSESDPNYDDEYETSATYIAKPTYTTSTIYYTETSTIIHCPAIVTDCPAYSTETTAIVKTTTTVCPVKPEMTYTPQTIETLYSTRLHTITADGYTSVSPEKYPVLTTTYSVPGAHASYKPAGSIDVKTVVGGPSSVPYASGYTSSAAYAPVYPSSLVSVPAKPVSAGAYYPVPSASTSYGADYTTTYKPVASTGNSATNSTPYGAQFTGAAGKIKTSAFAVVGAIFMVIFV